VWCGGYSDSAVIANALSNDGAGRLHRMLIDDRHRTVSELEASRRRALASPTIVDTSSSIN